MTLSYEIGPIRPPSEAYSLLVRFTRNCPWNKCEFCHLYKGERFERRPLAEIKKDIDTIKAIRDRVFALSRQRGEGGRISQQLVREIFSNPRYDDFFRTVAFWTYSGEKNVFIQDANSLVMNKDDLADGLAYLKQAFPTIDRVTSYCRSQTISQLYSVDDLARLKDSGLTRLHIGMETGDDFLLRYMRKGVTQEQHITAGRRVKESGIEPVRVRYSRPRRKELAEAACPRYRGSPLYNRPRLYPHTHAQGHAEHAPFPKSGERRFYHRAG